MRSSWLVLSMLLIWPVLPHTAVAKSLAVRVQGNHLVDADGAVLQLRGVNVSGLESVAIQGWSAADPWGGWKPKWSALQEWKVNVIRLPMNEASWLGYSCADKDGKSRDPDPGKNYRSTVLQTVEEANAAGIYVILDLQWTAPGNYCPLGQNPMADTEHSIEFWKQVAEIFKAYPAVMFDLFNEPFLSKDALGWDAWLNGGGQTRLSSPLQIDLLWRTAGMQKLLDTVRAAGAANVVLMGGLGYSNDLSGWPEHGPSDALHQLAAAWHVYSDNGYVDAAKNGATQAMLTAVSADVPILITEIGDSNASNSTGAFASGMIGLAERNGYSYLGWTWNHWGQASNELILDNNGTPSPGFGTAFKAHLVCRAVKSNCK